MDETKGVWRTVFGRHIFIKDGQSLSDAMKESGKYDDDCVEKIKQTEKAKADSGDKPKKNSKTINIDFDKDNVLPELNDENLADIGVKKNKPVLLKKTVIDRNRQVHPDVSDSDMQAIIEQALYGKNNNVFRANAEKPYYHFANFVRVGGKGKTRGGLALLDIDESKDNFEIVHLHYISTMRLLAMIKKNKKD